MRHCPFNQDTNLTLTPSNQTANMASVTVVAIALHGLFSSIGIVENLLIIWVVGFHVRRSVISVWILNLAASDLLATASLPFFTFYMARGNTWTLGRTFCRVYSSVFFLNMFFSGFLLAAISLDRCLVVLKPVWAQNHRNIRLVVKVCGMIWASALVCTVPFYVFRDTIHLPDGKILCYYNYIPIIPHEAADLEALCRYRKEALVFMKLFLAFLIPLSVIILSYATVNSELARRGSRRSFCFVRLVVAVVVTFILCWAPYHFFIVLEVLAPAGHPAQQVASGALNISATLGFLNSVLNPVLYVFSCPDLCGKIRHSLAAVMDSVLAEDLAELSRRGSTVRGSISAAATTNMLMKKRTSTGTTDTRSEQVEDDGNVMTAI